VTEDQSAPTKQTGLRSWLPANTIAAVSIVGAFVYGVTRISYVGFYGEFGLDPEDVGIGYAAMLARALPGLLVCTAVLLLGFIAYSQYMRWAMRRRGEPGIRRPKVRLMLRTRSRLAGYSAALAVCGIGLLFVYAPLFAQTAARAVTRGEELRAPSGVISWGMLRDPLGFTVRKVDVEWVEGASSGRTELGEPLMLLGSDSDVYYLYDVEFKRTLRLPRSLVILREDIG
jgi:hypothetical protein